MKTLYTSVVYHTTGQFMTRSNHSSQQVIIIIQQGFTNDKKKIAGLELKMFLVKYTALKEVH